MKYRSEIDGLRAVAVMPVILFHAGVTQLSGGFVGVDVFFVISGYLITSILLNDLENDKFSIVTFYERRARRILPALVLVMLVCIPLAWSVMLPEEFDAFVKSLVGVVLFVSNILFWLEEGYFSATAELKPLLHTWSLAVEEQFYVVFPVFLALTWRFGRSAVFWMIAVLALLSLALCEWWLRHGPSAAYYLAHFRAWELLAGALCAFVLRTGPLRVPPLLRNLLSLAGLVAIVYAVDKFNKHTPFPGLSALIPVGGTCLIILFATPKTWVGALLSLRAVVGIGLISYSAYLWHQPLFAFARLTWLQEPPFALMLGLAGLSLVLAWGTWKFVEQPFRHGKGMVRFQRRHIFMLSAVASIALLLAGAFLDNSRAFFARLDDRAAQFYSYLAFNETAAFETGYRSPDCFLGGELQSFANFQPDTCLGVVADRPNVLLIGDSHAAHWWYGLGQALPGINLLQATSSGCRPLLPLEGRPDCTQLAAKIFDEVLPEGKIDAVILSSRWQNRDAARLEGTLAFLRQFDVPVLLMGPTVEYHNALPRILMQDGAGADPAAHAAPYLNRNRFAQSRQMQAQIAPQQVVFVDVIAALCGDETDCRVLTESGVPMAWDYGHFTLEGASETAIRLREMGAFDVLLGL